MQWQGIWQDAMVQSTSLANICILCIKQTKLYHISNKEAAFQPHKWKFIKEIDENMPAHSDKSLTSVHGKCLVTKLWMIHERYNEFCMSNS